jgi:hypothetical protein
VNSFVRRGLECAIAQERTGMKAAISGELERMMISIIIGNNVPDDSIFFQSLKTHNSISIETLQSATRTSQNI